MSTGEDRVTEDVLAALVGPGVSVRVEVGLAPLTTLRVGGPARFLVTVDSEDALVRVAAVSSELGLPLLVLGRGSNLLIPDEGWPGVVLRLGAGLRGVTFEGTTVWCGGAEPLPSVAVRTAQQGLAGFAWGCAVPGTIGGGVRMNAGAHGADMASSLVSARVLDPSTGTIERWDPARLDLGYRRSALPDGAVVTAVELALEPAPAADVLAEIDRIRAWRRAHQPLSRPSCGSVFTNPPDASAGELIDRLGLKGRRVGGAEVSSLHANFIVTSPGATATDVATLIDEVRAAVQGATGIDLHPEVVRPVPGTPSRDDRHGGR
jgi:UDP-N-acetylmuramate dehydrogenase